jgi:hypothetical protein
LPDPFSTVLEELAETPGVPVSDSLAIPETEATPATDQTVELQDRLAHLERQGQEDRVRVENAERQAQYATQWAQNAAQRAAAPPQVVPQQESQTHIGEGFENDKFLDDPAAAMRDMGAQVERAVERRLAPLEGVIQAGSQILTQQGNKEYRRAVDEVRDVYEENGWADFDDDFNSVAGQLQAIGNDIRRFSDGGDLRRIMFLDRMERDKPLGVAPRQAESPPLSPQGGPLVEPGNGPAQQIPPGMKAMAAKWGIDQEDFDDLTPEQRIELGLLQ